MTGIDRGRGERLRVGVQQSDGQSRERKNGKGGNIWCQPVKRSKKKRRTRTQRWARAPGNDVLNTLKVRPCFFLFLFFASTMESERVCLLYILSLSLSLMKTSHSQGNFFSFFLSLLTSPEADKRVGERKVQRQSLGARRYI